jgi:hypothetical protein
MQMPGVWCSNIFFTPCDDGFFEGTKEYELTQPCMIFISVITDDFHGRLHFINVITNI